MSDTREAIDRFHQVDLDTYLSLADQVILPSEMGGVPDKTYHSNGKFHVGVDLGTAYIVLVVLNEELMPVAGEYQFAQVVRDGLVVDFIGAVDLLREMKARVENRLGVGLDHAATGFPPGVPMAEVRATANVLDSAGLYCTRQIDEPSAANKIIRTRKGAIVDVGGGTTGIAVLEDGEVVYTADEATGGTHFSLVIAGSLGITFEEAERMKKDPKEQPRLFPVIRPVMEKVANIVSRHIEGRDVQQITLVGGTAAFPGMDRVVQQYTGVPTAVPARPLFVTPLGIAAHDHVDRG